MSSITLARLFEKSFSRSRTRRALDARRFTLSHEVVCLEDRVLLAVALGTAESFAVLGGSTVTNTGPTVIRGNLGVSPGAAVTGFPPGSVVPPATIHAADAVALQAQSDVTIAYNDLAGRASNFNLTGQDLGGLTLVPGVYTFTSSAQLTGTLTLDAQGNPDAEFIFQIGSTITTASNASVNVINSADGCNVYWQVGSSATLGTNTAFTGNILALTSITLVTNATILDGRALARNGAVTMDSNQVSIENCGIGSISWEKRTTDANPVLLGGATFEITPNPLTGLGTLIVVDGGANDADGLANGLLQVSKVLIGTYTITETIAPPGFAIDDDATRSVTVTFDGAHVVIGTQGQDDPGNTDESDFHNRLISNSISWEKRATDANPILLGGATFEISPNPVTGVGTLIVVDGDVNDADTDPGQITVINVLLGTYIITETVSPAGFAIDDDASRTITVSAGDLNAVIGAQGQDDPGNTNESDFHNRLGSIAWEKRATDANPVLLGGATFVISPDPLDRIGTLTVVDGGANDADGLANGVLRINNVRLGTYIITETISPAGFAIDDDATRSITVSAGDLNAVVGTQGQDDPGNTNESDFHNRLGSIAWEKRATNANPVLLGGATFVISPDPLDRIGTLTVVDGGANDADGLANGVLRINNVRLGTYIITETVSPAGFAIDDDASRTITVSAGDLNAVVGAQGQDDPGNTNESDFHNRLGSIAWEKRATDANPVLLGGATFVISPDPLDRIGTLTVVDGGANDADGLANGVLRINNVRLGTYIITETISPAGFAIDDDATRSITVSAGDLNAVVGTQGQDDPGNTNESDFHNRLGSIAWEKRATNANPVLLGGATFVISPDPLDRIGTLTVVDGGANDADGLANGVLRINNVRLGTYIITETISPAGFAIDDDATRSITVSAGDLNAVVGTQGQDDPGNTNESDFHNRLVIVIGMGKSPLGPQFVTVIDQESGAVISQFAPYGSAFRGGVRVATGDLTGDGIDEIVTAPGWSIVAQVNVYSQAGGLLTSFQPYGSTFKGGVQVAVGDVDGDGFNDIITVPSFGPAEVKVFRNVLVGGAPTFDVQNPYRDFLAFPSSFIGGAVVAVADMGSTPLPNGPFDNTQRDQKAEIVVGSGAGIKTTVKVFDVSRMTTPTPGAMAAAAQSFTPFSTTTTNYKGGVSLSVARINPDLIPDIVVGAGVNGGSLVDVWAWSNTASATLSSLSANGIGFAAFTDASRTAPVQVAAQDTTGDGIADAILAVQGPGGTTNQIRSFSIISVSPLQVSPPTVIPGSYLGPYVIATIRNPLPTAVMPQPLIAFKSRADVPAVSPVSNTARPRFSWSTISNAATYEIWVDNLSTGQSQVIRETGLVTPEFTPSADLSLGRYRVWVRGLTAAGQASNWSAAQDWRVQTPPVVNGNSTTQSKSSFQIVWSPVPGATTYDVWVDRLTSNTSQYLRNTSVSVTSLDVTNFDIGQYAVWVRARNAQGDLSLFSSRIVFQVSLLPNDVSVTSTAFDGTPVLGWSAVPGATQYEVWVNNQTTNTSRVVHNTSVTATSLPLSGLTVGSYRAWVRARDAQGGSYAWTPTFSFEVQRAASVLTPSGTANSSAPLISWTAVSGAARYELWVSNLNTLVRVIHFTDITSTRFQPAANLALGQYRVWVRAIDGNGVSVAWSTPANFTVAQIRPVPSAKSPLKRLAVNPLADELQTTDEIFSDIFFLEQVLLAQANPHCVCTPDAPQQTFEDEISMV